MADLAQSAEKSGKKISVITSNRGYENTSLKYPSHETLHGIHIRRFKYCSFGKKNIFYRVLGGLSFLFQSFFYIQKHARNIEKIIVSTSPPFAGVLGWFFKKTRGIPFLYWVMDINPDQAVASGAVKKNALSVSLFNFFQTCILTQANQTVVLDRYMHQTLLQKKPKTPRICVLPPWPHHIPQRLLPPSQSLFRQKLGLLPHQKILMFSGNLSQVSPITTWIEAGIALPPESNLVFIVAGGGNGRATLQHLVQGFQKRFMLLPYQPLETLEDTLSCADAHMVSLGDNMVGINHPCKIYGALAVGRPILYLGPLQSHIGDILEKHPIGWHCNHGDIENAKKILLQIEHMPQEALASMGSKAYEVASSVYHKEILLNKMTSMVCSY